ncbi:MAG: hypothetical protein NTU73_00730 [Ignavibacteriae bacterium]|nr:hypothetical protein [Ignavibacteriota bacterium]
MKPFIIVILIINTVIFSIFAINSYKTFKMTEQNIQGIRSSIDTTNVRLKNINAALDDKLFGIISNLPKR